MSPVMMGDCNVRLGKPKFKPIKILFDSGTTSTIITHEYARKLRINKSQETKWSTKGGNFITKGTCNLMFRLPEIDHNKTIYWKVHVDSSNGPNRYDMIIGRDLMKEIKCVLDFDDECILFNNGPFAGRSAPMKDLNEFLSLKLQDEDEYFEYLESEIIRNATTRMRRILDASYEKPDLDKVTDACIHLTEDQRQSLNKLLKKHEYLFEGKLGLWNTPPVDLELKDGVKPYHTRPYPIPHIHKRTFKKELDRLCEIGVLRKINDSEWGAPTFIQPKKNGTIRFLSDFRELNKRIKRKPYPLPKIQDLLLNLEGFTYATSIDLNMGYYHVRLTPESSKLCTIVTEFGKYEYLRIPMGVCNSPDIFQERMSDLMAGLEYVRAYIDDILITTKGDWNDHLEKLDKVLQRLGEAGLQVNAEKSFFGKAETEYLGFWITREGVRPVAKKVEALKQLAPPTNIKQLRRFMGLVNYYRDMWVRRSHVLAPLSRLMSKNVKWTWTEVEQQAFEDIKKIMSQEVFLAYPNFNKPFDIYTDASHLQLGSVISQDGKPIAFYSRKLTDAQTRYTTTERELLAIVETLKEYHNILLGHEINVYTDHKNLTCKNITTERVMRWRLLLEEYGPNIHYIQGSKNIVADALSRLNINPKNTEQHPEQSAEETQAFELYYVARALSRLDTNYDSELFDEKSVTNEELAEYYGMDELPKDTFPLTYKIFDHYQRKDKDIPKKLKNNTYHTKDFRGGGKVRMLICHDDKIVVPKILQKYVVQWYHNYLLHPGAVRTEETIRQHLYWPDLRVDVRQYIKTCDTCQRFKKQQKKYGHLPAKDAEAVPWDRLCVDLIGPYTIKRKDGKELILKAVTMIDPATGWFEVQEYKDKRAATIANIVEQTWYARYPWPTIITYDRGNEFIGHAFEKKFVTEEYGTTVKGATVRNPQANAILERVHQVVANLVRTYDLEEYDMDDEDPWSGILAAAAFAVRSTYHTTLQATPGQLVYGRDMIFNIKHVANWKAIKERKQKLIDQNNKKENRKRIQHTYHMGDKVLLLVPNARKYERPYDGPYEITQVNTNGTVRLRQGAVESTYNIRQIKPYNE